MTAKYDNGHLYVLGGTETSGSGSTYLSLVTDITIDGGGNTISTVY